MQRPGDAAAGAAIYAKYHFDVTPAELAEWYDHGEMCAASHPTETIIVSVYLAPNTSEHDAALVVMRNTPLEIRSKPLVILGDINRTLEETTHSSTLLAITASGTC